MNMKTVLCASILLLTVLICGCTTTNSQNTVAAATPEIPNLIVPNLTGNWTGTMKGYDDGTGFNDYSGYTMTLAVIEQQDRVFSGEVSFTNQTGSPVWGVTPCAGVIGRDGKAITIIENEGGYSSGSLIASDEMELIYADGREPFSIAIDSLKKS
ncbi:MAG: hypothetical protein CVV31_10005 [Methanomicrobiales archaeon HGW-Methanomicrobiales-2]|jgi:hypothetical protein|nr:MAG: hypothetical protein CVV31_10005 [Methanomicrobiales archaeon HGW-Methanomicrobiales-2]